MIEKMIKKRVIMDALLMISIMSFCGCIEKRDDLPSCFCTVYPEIFDDQNFLYKKWRQKTPLKGGASGIKIEKVVDDDGKVYVVRDLSQRSHEDKIREIFAHKVASDTGYGPYVYAYSSDMGKIIMSLLNSSPQLKDPVVHMAALAESLKKMHQGPALCNHMSFIDQLKELYARTPYYPNTIHKNDVEKLIIHLDGLKIYPKKPTHRDLNPSNIFFTDRGVKFIDFENAGQDDLFIDIASIIVFYQYNTENEKKFLNLYFGRELSPEENEHLHYMKKFICLFSGLTHLSRVSHPQTYSHPLELTLEEIRYQMDSGGFSLDTQENLMILALAFLKSAITH